MLLPIKKTIKRINAITDIAVDIKNFKHKEFNFLQAFLKLFNPILYKSDNKYNVVVSASIFSLEKNKKYLHS